MQNSQTMVDTEVEQIDQSTSRKRKLEPKGKPVPKNEGDFVTPGGMNLSVGFDKHFGLYKVEVDRGIVPKELQGKFTEEKRARTAIEMYLQKNPRYRE